MISFHSCPLASLEGKETGGMNVYILELSKELAKMGFMVDMFTRCQDNKQPKIVNISQNLRLIHLVSGPPKPVVKKELIKYLPEFVDNFCRFVKDEKSSYNLLHCHYYLSGLAALEIKKQMMKNIPIIITFHTLSLMKNLVARDEMEKEDNLRIETEFTLVKKANRIICSSELGGRYLELLYDASKNRITVVNPGVDTNLFHPINKTKAKRYIKAVQNHKIILFVGRIEPIKGLDVLLYTMKMLINRLPNMHLCLWIVGGDVSQKTALWSKELRKLESLRQVLNVQAEVKFVGRKPQKELPYYYNAAEFVVMPSHYESFGLVALEAMACDVAVITTDVSGVSGVFDKKHQSLIASSNNPLLLAQQMEGLLTKKTKPSGLRQAVSDLTWENAAKKVYSVYENILSI